MPPAVALGLLGCFLMNAPVLGQAPTPAEVASEIQGQYDRLPGLHLKWKIATETHVDLGTDRLQRITDAYYEDEFAFDDGKQYRHVWAKFVNDSKRIRECVYITLGDVVHWQDIDYPSSAESAPPIPANYLISKHDPRMKHEAQLSTQYLQFIGSPYYDGKRLEVWKMHGFLTRIKVKDQEALRPFSVVPALKSGSYRTRDNQEAVDGIECWVVENPGLDTMWLAVEHGLALVKREWNIEAGGQVMCRYLNSDFEEASPGFWLPRTAKREAMVYLQANPKFTDETVHYTTTAELTSVKVGPVPDELFVHVPPEGSLVLDDTQLVVDGEPVSVTYRYGETVEEREQLMLEAVQRIQAKHRGEKGIRGPTGRLGLIVANIGLIVVVAVVLVLWRKTTVPKP